MTVLSHIQPAAATIQTASPDVLSRRCVIVAFSGGLPGTTRKDNRATDTVAGAHKVQRGGGKYSKALWSPAALKDATAILAAARVTHCALSAAWGEGADRIVPAARFKVWARRMSAHRAAFDRARDAFLGDYAHWSQAEPAARLGDLYDPSQYPTRDQVAAAFRFSLRQSPVPADWRTDMVGADMADARAAWEAQVAADVVESQRDTAADARAKVAKLADVLDAYRPGEPGVRAQGTFHQSTVDAVRDAAESLRSRNIVGDATLDRVADALPKLARHTAATLKDDPAKRADTRRAAERVAADLGAFMGA